MQLRPYQQDVKTKTVTSWEAGKNNVLAVMPTGAGKTVMLASIINDNVGASCCIAHRQELVSQISMALAREGVMHRVIAPPAIISQIVREHQRELGRNFVDRSARAGVAGVDTLVRRGDELRSWLASITLWVQDEAHHVLESNKWGTAAGMMPNARGLGLTATPCRADGMGLGAHADGVFNDMVEGPTMRWLIENKYLTEYRVFAPPSDMDLDNIKISAGGDFSKPSLKAASEKSHIIGDVVDHYLKIAPGKLGVVFATDVETSTNIAAKFNLAGVPAAVVSAKTPSADRAAILRDFKAKRLMVLVNVDLFGEGFDLPAIEVCIFARPTMSFALYAQQFGRALRLLDGKEYAIIIDHVGNVQRHGLPDGHKIWTLDRRERGAKGAHDPDLIPTRACINCTALYEAIYKLCPFCGVEHVPAGRASIQQVDGDLLELSPEMLQQLRGGIAKADESVESMAAWLSHSSHNHIIQRSILNKHASKQEAQTVLRDLIAQWAGIQKHQGRALGETLKRFYFRYQIDVASAQILNKADTQQLTGKLVNDLIAERY